MANIICSRLGVVHPQLYPQVMAGDGPVVETAGVIAAETELKAIEVTHVRDELTRARLKVLIGSAGLKVVFNALPAILRNKWDISAEAEVTRSEALAGLVRLMAEAKFLGAKLFVVSSGPDTAPEGRVAARGRLVGSLQALCEEGGKAGLAVTLEACDREVDQKCLVGPVVEAVEVAKQVKRENFGLTLDLAHLILNKERIGDSVSEARNYTLHAQLSNCVMTEGHPARGDQHPAFGTEGSLVGVEQVAEFLKALDRYGFNKKPNGGWLSLEVRPREEEYSTAVLAGALRTVSEALARL